MLASICKFIQNEDKNGDMLQFYHEYLEGEVGKDAIMECAYRILTEWVEDGLEVTNRVKGYLEYLESNKK